MLGFRKSKVQASSGRDAIDLDKEPLPLLSPDNSTIPSTGLLDDFDLGLTDFLVQDGPPSYISDTTKHSFLPEPVDEATRSTLDRTAGLCAQESIRSMLDFEDEDALFTEFMFPQTLPDQSLSQLQPTLNSSDRLTALHNSYASEPQAYHTNSKYYNCASPLAWVADWCGTPILQPAPPKPICTSLTPKVVESLLRDYFQFVNPLFPVVSEWDVYHLTHPQQLQARECPAKMSLALFNAIMFAASAVRLANKTVCEVFTDMFQFATEDAARAAGFPNIRAMRVLFHSKAQVRLSASHIELSIGHERAAKVSHFLRLCMRQAAKET